MVLILWVKRMLKIWFSVFFASARVKPLQLKLQCKITDLIYTGQKKQGEILC